MPFEQYSKVLPSTPPGAPGQKIPEPKPGDVLRRSFLSWIVRKLNAWQEATIQWGNKDKVHYGDRNVVIELNKNAPANSSGGSAQAQVYSLVSVQGDYLTCTDSNGGVVSIAKPGKLRNSIGSEIKFGNTYSYSYSNDFSDTNNLARHSVVGGSTEIQLVIPIWIPGDQIVGINDGNTGVVDGSGAIIAVQMVEDNRHWAQATAQFQGVPPGGATGQILAKASVNNYDAAWVTAASGGGGGGTSSPDMVQIEVYL